MGATSDQRDGRTVRAERTRQALVDSLIGLLDEGQLTPTAAAIAARAGVSERSVFQHFADRESLFEAVAREQYARVVPTLVPVDASLPLSERIDQFARQRAYLYERVGGVRRAALEGLADEPLRVLATTNRRDPIEPLAVPANARVVDWVSYARTMPLCDAVVCHAGHGTLARALASGAPVVACPHAGDMAENAARIRWAGAGVSLPRRFTTARGVRLAVRRVLGEPRYRRRAEELRDWAARNDGARAAAEAVEEFAESHKNTQSAG